MFTHLLVPLDGSPLAECVLPAAAAIAENERARVTLLHLVEAAAPAAVHGERHLVDEAGARQYLEDVARRAFPAGVQVATHVHPRKITDVAHGVVEHADELAPDLIVMCAHGRGGWRKLLFGSLGQQVVSLGVTPVLLIKPPCAPKFEPKKILVALDGDSEHEQGLCVATQLAFGFGAELQLTVIVQTSGAVAGRQPLAGSFLPSAERVLLDLSEQGAREYLEKLAEPLRQRKLGVAAIVRRGDPPKTIVDIAEETASGIIVLGTHGTVGTEAFWSGSVPAGIARKTVLPLLLVPWPEKPSE